MKVLSLGIGTQLFETGNPTRDRIIEYGKLADELHIIVYTQFGYQVTEKIKLGKNVWVYPTKSKNKPRYFIDAYKLAKEIFKKNPGRYIITSQEGMTHFVALVLSIRYKLGFEMQIHTDIFSRYFRKESITNKLRLLGYWLCRNRASSTRVVSKRIAKGLIEKWHVPGKKITILPILVNKEYWQNAQVKTDLHKEYPQFDQIILMPSRLTREKNFPLALQAFSIVRKRLPKTGLIVVGVGYLENIIKGDNVVLLPWSNDLASLYKTADLFLLTSNYEGFGLTLVEASICATPIVTTDVGAVGDLITPHNALIAPVGDAKKIAEHIIFILGNESVRSIMKSRLPKVADMLPDREVYLKLLKLSWEKCLKQTTIK
ncbi:MAG TPA: glycosyltransferase family 4 protein [Candidatus Paceibacterota bacterium]